MPPGPDRKSRACSVVLQAATVLLTETGLVTNRRCDLTRSPHSSARTGSLSGARLAHVLHAAVRTRTFSVRAPRRPRKPASPPKPIRPGHRVLSWCVPATHAQKTNRSFSSITLLVFHGACFTRNCQSSCSVRDAPGLFCQGCARSVPRKKGPLPRCFLQERILKDLQTHFP